MKRKLYKPYMLSNGLHFCEESMKYFRGIPSVWLWEKTEE